MTGGIFQGSSTADFSAGVVDLFTITVQPAVAWTAVATTDSGPFRYVRYLAPSGSYGNVAEIEFHGSFGVAIVPSVPSSLVAMAASSSQIDLSWTDNAYDETGFKLERSPSGTAGWIQIATLSANAESYSDTGFSAGTAYDYRLRSTNAAGDSAYTSTTSATTHNGLESFSAYGLAPNGSEDLLTPAGDGVAHLLKYAFNMLGSGAGRATINSGSASGLLSSKSYITITHLNFLGAGYTIDTGRAWI